MGHGSYTSSDWVKLKESKGISEKSSERELFVNKHMDDRYNPKFINMRESRDSSDSPRATPVIIGFDVTGSMGYLAAEIAKNSLNETITEIYNKQPVSNPHVMCAAIGDVCDEAPLQVTQFEADIRVVEQLMDLWLEGRGGDYPEAYNLLWYFADRHTVTDAYEKRNKKGFLFTIGDATVHDKLTSDDIMKVFGDSSPALDNKRILQSVSKKYEVFHIVTKARSRTVYEEWNSLLPGRVAVLRENGIGKLSQVIISLMQCARGMNKKDVINQWEGETRTIVLQALEGINPSENVILNKVKSFFGIKLK